MPSPDPRRTYTHVAALIAAVTILPASICAASDPMRIVVTNDDGVGELDDRILPLAEALVPFAEVYIVIPSQDRSGSTHFMSVGSRKRAIESELLYQRETERGRHRVEIHAVDGYPADCVALALYGLLDEPPDLVISGPNGGPNLGESWIGSGTVGAARMAAYLGVPAIAISGLDSDLEAAVSALSQWVATLARSELVLGLEPGRYLTVGLPRTMPSEIRGIRVAPRAPRLLQGRFERAPELHGADGRQVWLLQPIGMDAPPPGTDVALYAEGYIVITPMRAYEEDDELLSALQQDTGAIPAWETVPEG